MTKEKLSRAAADRLPLDRLRIPAKEVKEAVRKTAIVQIRLTPKDKKAMQATAKRCGCTLTEYLVSLHRLAAGKLGDQARS